MNKYYKEILDFQETLKTYTNNIFKAYGKELILRLEEYNLLQNENNCIESSTAIGYILEEFIISKLEIYTNCDKNKYTISRHSGATTNKSYDCSSLKKNIKFLINIKAEKVGVNNNAVAAIGQLYNNYSIEEPNLTKAYIVFKIRYSIEGEYNNGLNTKSRHIFIRDLKTYCLEEIDFNNKHMQDKRSWSSNGSKTLNNGRLIISEHFRKHNKLAKESISYKNTKKLLEKIINRNELQSKTDIQQ